MIFKNYKSLSKTKLRRDALEILDCGIKAVLPGITVKKNINPDDLQNFNRIFVVGVGKCSLDAALALEKILKDKISSGIVMDIRPGKLKRLSVYAGTHPLPSAKNIQITRKIIRLLKTAKKQDLVIFLISGGGSALLCQPKNHTLAQEKALLRCLFRSGARIQEINIIRKHLSLARGGFLAKYAYPAKVISLILSDVPGSSLTTIASGPTVKDSTTKADARKIIKKYCKDDCCQALAKALIETPKNKKFFKNARNILVSSNKQALKAMVRKARALGFRPKIVTARLQGEASKIGLQIAKDLKQAKLKTALLYGGETTVKVKGQGRGGRNLELALSALRAIPREGLIISLASDGKDNTAYAGGICDIITKDKAIVLGLSFDDYLKKNNSFNFFRKTGQFLLTGPTGTNVSDLIVALKL
jgi:hydroxypyruvate reductase